MRIAMFTETYPPTTDGVAAYVHALKKQLERMGHDVVVFTATKSREKNVHSFVSLTVPFYRQYKFAVCPYFSSYYLLRKFRPDVVHLHTPFAVGSAGLFVARALRVPVVGSFHTNIKEMSRSIKSIFANRGFVAMGWRYALGVYWRCNALTVPSNVVKDFIYSSAIKPFRVKIRVVWTLPDLEDTLKNIDRFDMRRELGIEGKFTVTFLSRITKDKGIYTFLGCAERNRDMVFLVGGTGPEEKNVKEYVKLKKLENVKILGFVPEEKKGALLRASDVVVLPSFADTFGIILIEAMACGAVAVGSNAGGIKEFLKDGENGLLFEAGNVEHLSSVLRNLHNNDAMRKSLKQNGEKFVREHGDI
ncbi:MAG: glycosyltransferase, partial [Thermoplasmata archaeon]